MNCSSRGMKTFKTLFNFLAIFSSFILHKLDKCVIYHHNELTTLLSWQRGRLLYIPHYTEKVLYHDDFIMNAHLLLINANSALNATLFPVHQGFMFHI